MAPDAVFAIGIIPVGQCLTILLGDRFCFGGVFFFGVDLVVFFADGEDELFSGNLLSWACKIEGNRPGEWIVDDEFDLLKGEDFFVGVDEVGDLLLRRVDGEPGHDAIFGVF